MSRKTKRKLNLIISYRLYRQDILRVSECLATPGQNNFEGFVCKSRQAGPSQRIDCLAPIGNKCSVFPNDNNDALPVWESKWGRQPFDH